MGLTETGREQALNLGWVMGAAFNSNEFFKSCPAEKSVSLFSSPVGRCMETAENIGRGLYETAFGNSVARCRPCVEPLQPLAEFFVQHYEAYMETHTTGFYQGICRWLEGSACNPDYSDPAYYPLARRSREMLDFLLERGRGRLNVFCSHDAWIVPCLAYFCKFKFTPRLWMNFLTGIAFVVRNALPDAKDTTNAQPHIDRIVAVTGLEDGNMYF